MVRNLSEIMYGIFLKSGGWQDIKDLEKTFFYPYYPGIKADIDLTPYLGKKVIEKIHFGLKNL